MDCSIDKIRYCKYQLRSISLYLVHIYITGYFVLKIVKSFVRETAHHELNMIYIDVRKIVFMQKEKNEF